MSPVKNDEIVAGGRELDIRKVVVADIQDSTDEKKLPNGDTIALPYMVEVETVDKPNTLLTTEPSTAVLFPKEWNKKFFVRTSEKDGNKYKNVAFTRNHDFLAVAKVLEAKGEIKLVKGQKFSVNSLIKKTFEAVVVIKNEYQFIDWVSTFEHNGVPVPTMDELEGKVKKIVDNTKAVKEAGLIDDDLPF